MTDLEGYEADDIRVGLRATDERDITEQDVLTFARLSGDLNPLHSDAAYATTTTLGARIVHGAFQVGLASALLGMRLPGKQVLLGSIDARFPSPLYFPTRVRISGEIMSWNLNSRSGRIRISIQDMGSMVLTAAVSMGFMLHERTVKTREHAAAMPQTRATPGPASGRRLVAVTGAAGDLGQAIVATLTERYDVLALVNRDQLPDGIRNSPRVTEMRLDLAEPEAGNRLRDAISGRPLFGVVHAAWPGAPRGGLLEAEPTQVEAQVGFASVVTVGMARALFNCVGDEGGRFVAISSTAGSLEPQLSLAVYSLGKACLDEVVRLLAPELSRKKITINAVSPSFMHLGINRHVSERSASRERAGVPAGRLCSSADVVSMVCYLLSDDASFVSGQVLSLTGGKL